MGEKAPSWPAVLRTTLRLWLERRKGRRRSRLLGISVAVVTGLVLVLVAVFVTQPSATSAATKPRKPAGLPGPPAHQVVPPDPATLRALTLASGQAADWVAKQVSAAAVIWCDPAMCAVLKARGVPAAQLLAAQSLAAQLLATGNANPAGAAVVVATPGVRGQLGARLTSGYAPELIASFGADPARVDLRAAMPVIGSSYATAAAADRADRISAGQQLLRNKRIGVSRAARAALTVGDVDPRLLVTIGALAARQRLNIVSFGDPSPGAPDVPLRSALVGVAKPARLVTFLRGQRSPYQPDQVLVVQIARGQRGLSIGFDAPGPLGLGG
jgi:hypothetical protein